MRILLYVMEVILNVFASWILPLLIMNIIRTVVWPRMVRISPEKDVERLFGALKQRFRWLSHSVEYHDIKILGFAVQVASISY